jgi:hypothetical protein
MRRCAAHSEGIAYKLPCLPHHATEADLYVLTGTAEPVIEVEVAERGVEIVALHQADHPFAEPDAFSPWDGAGCGATCLGNFGATPRSVLASLSLAGFAGLLILGVQRDGGERRRKAEDRKAEQTYTGHVRTRVSRSISTGTAFLLAE